MLSRTLDRKAQILTGLSVAFAALAAPVAAMAQDAAPAAAAAAAAPTAPSPDAMTNLIRLLVAKGTLTQADGDALLAQAQSEAATARAAQVPPPPPVAEGAVRVTRVPEAVRAQIRDEIRGEIMAQAASEGWVTKNQAAPEWTRRIKVFGDIRVRSQSQLYSKANADTILDFQTISQLGPVDYNNTAFLPLINTRIDRINRLRIRARLGVEAEVVKGVTGEFALGSGDDNSPISENDSLGGGLAKRNIWLDLANFKISPTSWSTFSFGRFENPFATTRLLYDPDLRFDGVAGQFRLDRPFGDQSQVALTAGAFPLDFGPDGFPNNATVKRGYPSRWLLTGELKLKGEVADGIVVNASAGYHRFVHLQGKLSEPCNLDTTDFCTTDALTPLFLRRGNTLFALRNLSPNTAGIRPQLLGLKFGYSIIDFNLGVKVPVSDSVSASLSGEYLRNIAFRRSDICSGQIDTSLSSLVQPINNVTATGTQTSVCTGTNPARFNGGNVGWMGKLGLGTREQEKRGSWMVSVEYRYLQSDAVLDALTDSDFHLGGTNAKGYVLSGEYGIADGLTFGGHWYSTNEVAGEPYALDMLQLDLKAKF